MNILNKSIYKMISQIYLERMKNIQRKLLVFLEDESNTEESFKTLKSYFDNIKIYYNQHELRSLLHLLIRIGNNHSHTSNLYCRIFQILKLFQKEIKKYFSNIEIFTIFKSNKRFLLFLIENKMMTFDYFVAKKITSEKYIKSKYPQYFTPEILPFVDEKWFPKSELNWDEWIKALKNEKEENFLRKRKEGQNDSLICQYIRKDLIKEFVRNLAMTNCPRDSIIKLSVYETNHFLIKKQIENNGKLDLIEYAAFYGSLKIVNYLSNKYEMKESLYHFVIHSNDIKIIHLYEDAFGDLNGKLYECYILESLKCHHNRLVGYFLNSPINRKLNSKNVLIQCLKNYNYAFIQNNCINKSYFFYLCKYDYYVLVDILMKTQSIKLNLTSISF